jgi:hypothetical protein
MEAQMSAADSMIHPSASAVADSEISAMDPAISAVTPGVLWC